MQLILPTIWEPFTQITRDMPAFLAQALLPHADATYMHGDWGFGIVQVIKRKDYTWALYHFQIKLPEFILMASSSTDNYSFMAVTEGTLQGSLVLDTHESLLTHYRKGENNRWRLAGGASTIIQIENAVHPETLQETKPAVYLPRVSLLQVRDLKEKLDSQVAPELYLDGVVALLLQEYEREVAAINDQQYLTDPPFHFTEKDLQKIKKAKAIIDASVTRRFGLRQLAQAAGTNMDLLKKGFKYVYGKTTYQYWLSISLAHAKELLETTNGPIKAVAGSCGFENYSHFIQQFKKRFGVSPGQLRKTI